MLNSANLDELSDIKSYDVHKQSVLPKTSELKMCVMYITLGVVFYGFI